MAEIVGVVSAGIGVAAFAIQVSHMINHLRDTREYNKRKAGDEVVFLVGRLQVLWQILLSLETDQTSKMVELALALEGCQLAYSRVDNTLQRVSKKLSNSSGRKLRVRHREDIKDELRDGGQKLDNAIQGLTCALVLDSRRETHKMAQDMVLLASSSPFNSTVISKKQLQHSTPGTQVSIVEPPLPHTARTSYLITRTRRSRALDCTVKHCYCSCHSRRRSSARFWAVEYSPPSTFSTECSNPKCTATGYRWSLQFALSRYGIPFKVNTVVEFITGAGRYSLRPGLSIERVVKYTSPGFEALWRFENGLLTLTEVQEKFRELKRCDPALKQHINPGGRNYVQELLQFQGLIAPVDQFELLEFFACELGMTLEGLDQRFLVQCAKWIGEGPHIDLLEAIIAYGFDPGNIESPAYEEWPLPCSPGWYCGKFTPDPFFIDYLTLLADASPGFAGLTPLHEIVLLDTPASVTSFLLRSSLHMERNFLGQTPLHLAIRDVQTVRLLVQGGHDMDIPDNHGITPLMYAAGMGKTDVVRLLIKQGANLFLYDTLWKRSFIGYAYARGHWQLIMDALDTIKATYPTSVFQHVVRYTIMRFISRDTWLVEAWSTCFAQLVSLCSDINMRFSNSTDGTENNNLLHFISNHEDAKVLVRHGFKLFNEPNSAGNSAIFSLHRVLDATLTQSLLGYGTNVNHVNHKGRTLLFPLLREMKSLNFRIFDIMDSIRICLSGGLDIFLSDCCRCSCSPNGCFLPAAFDITFNSYIWRDAPAFVWALEFVSLVEDFRGPEDSKRLLLGFLRRTYSDRVGLTHVCCHRGNSIRDHALLAIAEDEIDEILDEEEEFIASLEEEMLPLTTETLERLRSKWIFMLRERYQEQLEAAEKRRKQRNYSKVPFATTHEVDYKNDEFRHAMHINPDFSVVPVAYPMAEYIIWLEHQYLRSEDTWDAAYNRRVKWFVELMQIMEVTTETLTREIDNKMKKTSWGEDKHSKEHIVSHFMASVQDSWEAGRGISEENSRV